MNFYKAFTLLELVFVVCVLGILASLSFPFFGQSKDDAKFLRVKMDYEMLTSALALMRNEAKIKDLKEFTPQLDTAKIHSSKEKLFVCENLSILCSYSLLQNPIYSNYKAWIKIENNLYRFFLTPKESIDFFYNAQTGNLECLHSKRCKEL
ncbi:prepilin-type N-terminal cleavage/methylation domain-containing protein [Campylobacter sp. MIT 21-1685]|uniref:type II secretion system protein n=1 Tax=unclassified Campylobacter TaxID=2593542 RepID=UPI00224B4280|nr:MULTISPECIES: prepilin-type N-terminal cleavage/methylation domain-containing protein [unclassified Campylobacter]MCX2682340.1 prepilin-type N-terminal cleavage/methylation domain-containing protein [Campylobacter sp. MIT 21-1684]MCX2750620.1 prepilin-type N-terminal cleavage/methylation domain-containing protein [Campylobacter sp. MIT 21-1682]MCX2806832.1 prepilin-type N-terminal cleavage/methylation domain-containing protein [Campylobacter sp. MIT 21-1685]